MNPKALTGHARRRAQQRAVPPFVLDILEECGSAHHCDGAERLVFDKAARRRVRARLGGERGLRLIEPWLDVYAVIRDGQFVTVAHQTGHMRRD